MSSQMGYISTHGKAAYSAVKTGLIGLTKVRESRQFARKNCVAEAAIRHEIVQEVTFCFPSAVN